MDGKDALFYMELLDMYLLLDTKVMDRILKDFWTSNIDSNGSFFQMSVNYQILYGSSLDQSDDYENSHRFYSCNRSIETTRSHKGMMKVWQKSMNIRYFLESFIFLSLALAF